MWSRLQGTDLWKQAEVAHASPAGRLYHGFPHPMRLYEIAEMLGIPYDPDLDKGILTHDVIYDNLPHKELRSAAWLLERDPGAKKAVSLIHSTIHHDPGEDNRLILLDLYDIGDAERALKNRDLIAGEYENLYGLPREDFLAGNATFMLGLAARLNRGFALGNVKRHEAPAFQRIVDGIDALYRPSSAQISP